MKFRLRAPLRRSETFCPHFLAAAVLVLLTAVFLLAACDNESEDSEPASANGATIAKTTATLPQQATPSLPEPLPPPPAPVQTPLSTTATPTPVAPPVTPEPTATPTPVAPPVTPEPTATPEPVAPTVTPTGDRSLTAYLETCEADILLLGLENAGVLPEDDELATWGDIATFSEILADFYLQLDPPAELSDFHDAQLRSIRGLAELARSYPTEDSFIAALEALVEQTFQALFELPPDLAADPEAASAALETALQDTYAEFFGPELLTAFQDLELALGALDPDVRLALDGSTCYELVDGLSQPVAL